MPQIDHLIYYAADLANGINEIVDVLKVRPAIGGCHPIYGTHNALVSLGPTTYLEIMAPDPELQEPDRGVLFQVPASPESRLITWVLRVEAIKEFVAATESRSLGLGSVLSGRRENPNGNVLTWQLTDPYACRSAVRCHF